jgi:hopanoid biosynthesis associated RND transporter like protein HpnN
MFRSPIVRLVDLCARHAWPVIALVFGLSACCALYAAQHFAIKTDVNQLFPSDLTWTSRANRYSHIFPDYGITVVVEAPSPEQVDEAAAKLAAALAADHRHFQAVDAAQSGPFFARENLLFLPLPKLTRIAGSIGGAAPLVGTLAADPSLRGALSALSAGVMSAVEGAYPLDALARPLDMASDTVDAILAGRPASFSWRALASGKPPAADELHPFIRIQPILDYHALQPGRAAEDAVVQTANRLNLARDYQAQVRLTGLVPIDDAQFSTLQEHAVLNLTVTVAAVLIILWLALRSWRIILAAALSLVCGLAISAGVGLYLVGSLNLISVAFFVLFVGLGVDFGIQFSVRYRAERHEFRSLHPALISAARKAGGPLALAATATALGFSAFLPTAYRGLSELGEIAGPGMIVAFLTSITLLPALLAVLRPPGEPRPMGFGWLAPVDRFVARYRIPVVATTLALVVLASPLLLRLPFDFDPVHLQNPHSEAVSTFLELRRDPQTGANAADVMEPDLKAADRAAKRLAALPQVSRATTLSSLVPSDQRQKLTLIGKMAAKLGPAINPAQPKPPSDQQNIDALLSTAQGLAQFAKLAPGAAAAAAHRLSGLLGRLAKAGPAMRQRATAAFIEPLQADLFGLKASLGAQPVTVDTIPAALKRQWLSPGGQARVQVPPKGDPEDTAVLRAFVAAVLKVAPHATGPAVTLYEAGNTIVRAFIEAGIFALASISLLLWITLRRIADVLLTLVPLLLAAVVTLELCVVLDLPLNFANIIALPLLLGVGVAFKIYYIMAWRRGRTALVQSTLSRAVIFSAMTNATAFGSLSMSSNPGTSSMGELMGLALLSTMAAAVLFQPALMGPPRTVAGDAPPPASAVAPPESKAAPPPGWVADRRGGWPDPRVGDRGADIREEEPVSHDRER